MTGKIVRTLKYKKARTCMRCKNHGIITLFQGHRPNCKFKNCECESCQYNLDRQRRNEFRTIHLQYKLFQKQNSLTCIEKAVLLEAIQLLMHCFLSRSLLPFIYAVLKTFYHGDEDGHAISEGLEIVKDLMAAK